MQDRGRSSGTCKTVQTPEVESTFAAPETESVTVEVCIDLTDIDIDHLETQPEMASGNLVKRSSEAKVSTLTPERKKGLAKPENELSTWMEHAVVEEASRKGRVR